MFTRYIWVSAVAVLLASTASARDDRRHGRDDDGRHEHDGFYFRAQLGLGYTRASTTDDALALKGGSGALNLEIGGAPVRNFIIFAKLFGTSTPSPSIEVGDITVDTGDEDTSSDLAALGVGVTYYFMPANVYLTGALSITQLSITEDGERVAETDTGGGLHLGVGKEWWVSDNWGLGIGAELALARIRGEGNDDWNAVSGVVFFSATFN